MTQWILSAQGRPFSDRSAAIIKRDRLVRELGGDVPLEVIPHPEGGFVVAAVEQSAATGEQAAVPFASERVDLSVLDPSAMDRVELTRQGSSSSRGSSTRARPFLQPAGEMIEQDAGNVGSTDDVSASVGNASEFPQRQEVQKQAVEDAASAHSAPARAYADRLRLSPSTRAFLFQHVQALLGVVLAFQPHLMLRLLGVEPSARPAVTGFFLVLIAVSGLVLLTLATSRWLWAYTANTYLIDANGVEQVQWYWAKWRLRRRAARVNFMHLRAADVEQTMMQMLLNVGSVKLASGGTDGYEVILTDIAAPRALATEFQRRARQLSVSSVMHAVREGAA